MSDDAYYTLDGVDCRTVGIHVLEYPDIVIPTRRTKKYEVPGGTSVIIYDGDWGYDDIEKTIRCTVDEDADLTAVSEFLTPGIREIVFGNEPEYCFRGMCQQSVELYKAIRARKKRNYQMTYICEPFKRLAFPGDDIVMTQNGSIEHPGTARSCPIIKIEGSGNIDLCFRGTDHFTVNGLESATPIIIDTDRMIATTVSGLIDKTGMTEGDFPYLYPGENALTWTGSVTQVTITPNFAFI